MSKKIIGVIMAGGIGSRFWPESREKNPKQLLKMFGDDSMIQLTAKRIEKLVNPSEMFVVTNKLQRNGIVKQLPQIPQENILIEPFGRNTAPCIGLAALFAKRVDPDSVMIVLPADHLIKNTNEFQKVLENAIEVADKSKSLVTIGITPTRPETGYGYIQFDEEKSSENNFQNLSAFKVKTFAEKPTQEIAKEFLRSGDFVWNSGMFIWRTDVILKEIANSLPEMYEQLLNIEESIGTTLFEKTLEEKYKIIRGISIDYGVMEKAKDVFVIKSDFGWNDVGSWEEVYQISNKDKNLNSLNGKIITVDTKNSYISSKEKLIATVGVENLIIIETEDSILICSRDKAQDVKEIVNELKKQKWNEFL